MSAGERTQQIDALRPVAQGFHGAVVAGHPAVALAGLDALRNGGNAIDSGVTMGLATTTVLSHESSFLGVAPTLIHGAENGEVVNLDGTGVWSQNVSLSRFQALAGPAERLEALHTLTPGTPDAWIAALSRFGTLSFAEAAAPALRLAEHGFPMYPYLHRVLSSQLSTFSRWPGSAAVFVPGGRVPAIGERFIQRDLAKTLRAMCDAEASVSARGREAGLRAVRDYVYKGPIAERYVAYCRSLGGVLAAEDLANYAGRSEMPAYVGYRGLDVYSTGLWGQGPVFAQALKILEGFDLQAMGHNSVDYIHTVSQALNLAFADREAYMGDPRFTGYSLTDLLSEPYLVGRRALIDPACAWPEMPPAGDPVRGRPFRGSQRSPKDPATGAAAWGRSGTGTAYFGAIDGAGNIFSCTASDGARTCPIIPGTGMGLSVRGIQSKLDPGHAASPAPGKRPRLTPSPALVLKRGKPFMALGGFGGDKIPQATLQVFLNAVEFGLCPQAALEQPRFYSFNFPSSSELPTYLPGVLKAEARILETVLCRLREFGHKVGTLPDWWEGAGLYGMLRFDDETGAYQAGGDPRGGTCALAF